MPVWAGVGGAAWAGAEAGAGRVAGEAGTREGTAFRAGCAGGGSLITVTDGAEGDGRSPNNAWPRGVIIPAATMIVRIARTAVSVRITGSP